MRMKKQIWKEHDPKKLEDLEYLSQRINDRRWKDEQI
jgi:hypothetical protein